MSGLTKSLYATTPLMVEALGLRDALAFAGNLGIRLLEVDNDCLELVQACKNEINRMEIFSILTDINFLKRNFHDLTFRWTPREGNRVAHQLAQLASRNALPLSWVWNPPPCLQALIVDDKRSAAVLTFPFDPGGSVH